MSHKNELNGIIFDMDGVLVNSSKYITSAFTLLLKEYGIVLTDELRRKSLGLSLRDQLLIWEKEFGLKESIDLKTFSARSFEIELSLMKHELVPNKDLLLLIAAAKKKGISIGVATSSTKKRAEIILNFIQVNKHLDAFITSEDVAKHKPHPDIFLAAAKKMGVKPEDCVVFEDALNGLQAAKAANMKTVGVLTDFNDIKTMSKQSDCMIHSFSEVTLSTLQKLYQ